MQQARTQKSAAAQLETPRSENGRAMQIAGLRYHYADEPWKGLAEQWQRFVSHMGKIPGQVGRTAYGVNFLLPNGVDYLAGVEVSGNSALPEDFATVSIPAQKYLAFPHREHVSKLHETCGMAGEWLAANGYEVFRSAGAPDFFERYTEEFNPSRGTGGMEIWIPIKS